MTKASSHKTLLKEIDNFLIAGNGKTTNRNLVPAGLRSFLRIPNTVSATLYILNEETFVFEHYKTLPEDADSDLLSLYEVLIDESVIGHAIRNKQNTQFDVDLNGSPVSGMLILLPKPSGILGFILLLNEDNSENAHDELSDLIRIFAGLFSESLQNKFKDQAIERLTMLLEQKVASRTYQINKIRRELQSIINSVLTGILVTDPKTDDIISANPAACRVISKTQEEIIESNLSAFFIVDYSAFSSEEEEGFAANVETSVINIEGFGTPVLLSVSNIKIGEKKHRIISFTDITERKNAELALRKVNENLEQKVQDRTEDLRIMVQRLKKEVVERVRIEHEVRFMLEKEKELNELKSRFVSMVSHEFRTPLTIINSAAQILNRYGGSIDESETEQYLNRIMKTVALMTNLLENVIFIGKAEVKMIEPNNNKVDIKQLCLQTSQDIELTSNNLRKITFNHNCLTEFVYIDETLLQHVLINLLSNAVKYSDPETEVILDLYADGKNIIIKVTDQGIGIAEDEQKMIFDQFYRAKNIGNRPGTGLGMSVITRSLEVINGEIELESKINEGSTFTIRIPSNI